MQHAASMTARDAREPFLGTRERRLWRAGQALSLAAGAGTLTALAAAPELGLHLVWDVLIPIAPALLVLAPGLWRNVCPIAAAALLPRHLGFSQRIRAPRALRAGLRLAGFLALLAIVPLRHPAFDLDASATLAVLLAVAGAGVLLGFFFEWKAGWCAGLCPIHPVEELYGERPLLVPRNAHCRACAACVERCPDSIPAARGARRGGLRQAVVWWLMPGFFPGFVFGWFHVPDTQAGLALGPTYGPPLLGGAATLALYVGLGRWLPEAQRAFLRRLFACAAVACYYWYRLPALVGYGPFPGDGMLVDLRGLLPGFAVPAARAATTAFFAWWLLVRRGGARAWLERPPFAAAARARRAA